MKLILEVPDARAAFVVELLRSLTFVRAKPLSKVKAGHIKDMLEAMAEVDDIKKGKAKPRTLKQVVSEL